MKKQSYVITAHLEQVAKYWKELDIKNIESIQGISGEPLLKLTYEWEDNEEEE